MDAGLSIVYLRLRSLTADLRYRQLSPVNRHLQSPNSHLPGVCLLTSDI